MVCIRALLNFIQLPLLHFLGEMSAIALLHCRSFYKLTSRENKVSKRNCMNN